ncbi:uncharacterized protein N7473_009405 [Penicillium subrubescens]|nr:uncharacterized protein N7473_009405 [Penicillium subrubescens]KAJ5886731.1 hypothetical protein N7473_009405 [Penicillium subrubescens]
MAESLNPPPLLRGLSDHHPPSRGNLPAHRGGGMPEELPLPASGNM